jgi:hypothetical protein
VIDYIIGRFLVKALTAETPDAAQIIADFKRNSLTTYQKWADSRALGWALDTEQKFEVGDEVLTIKDKDDTKVQAYATCPVNGLMTLLHSFETVNFVPIGKTPFEARAVLAKDKLGEAIRGKLDDNGLGTVQGCTPNTPYQITFYPGVGEREIQALHASYGTVITELSK